MMPLKEPRRLGIGVEASMILVILAIDQMNANSNPIAAKEGRRSTSWQVMPTDQISGSDIADTTHWRYLGEVANE